MRGTGLCGDDISVLEVDPRHLAMIPGGNRKKQRVASTAGRVLGESTRFQNEPRFAFNRNVLVEDDLEPTIFLNDLLNGRASMSFGIPFSRECPRRRDLPGFGRIRRRGKVVLVPWVIAAIAMAIVEVGPFS